MSTQGICEQPSAPILSTDEAAAALELRHCPGKGRGVFARQPIRAGQRIERAPVLVIPDAHTDVLEHTVLKDYYFAWGDGTYALPLGWSVLYNHSDTPNAATRRNVHEDMIEFVALRDIAPGEEITFRYACPPWFDVLG